MHLSPTRSDRSKQNKKLWILLFCLGYLVTLYVGCAIDLYSLFPPPESISEGEVYTEIPTSKDASPKPEKVFESRPEQTPPPSCYASCIQDTQDEMLCTQKCFPPGNTKVCTHNCKNSSFSSACSLRCIPEANFQAMQKTLDTCDKNCGSNTCRNNCKIQCLNGCKFAGFERFACRITCRD